jgi:hypothetical protein
MPGVSVERKRGVLGVALDDGELDWRHVGGRGGIGGLLCCAIGKRWGSASFEVVICGVGRHRLICSVFDACRNS